MAARAISQNYTGYSCLPPWATINKAHPLARNLAFAWHPKSGSINNGGGLAIDGVRGRRATYTHANISYKDGAYYNSTNGGGGAAISFNGAETSDLRYTVAAECFSFLAVISPAATGSTGVGNIVGCSSWLAAEGWKGWSLRQTTTQLILGDGGTLPAVNLSSTDVGRKMVVIGTLGRGTNGSFLYIDGKGTAGTKPTFAYSASSDSQFVIGARADTTGGNTAESWPGYIYQVAVWNRFLNPGEVDLLTNNPTLPWIHTDYGEGYFGYAITSVAASIAVSASIASGYTFSPSVAIAESLAVSATVASGKTYTPSTLIGVSIGISTCVASARTWTPTLRLATNSSVSSALFITNTPVVNTTSNYEASGGLSIASGLVYSPSVYIGEHLSISAISVTGITYGASVFIHEYLSVSKLSATGIVYTPYVDIRDDDSTVIIRNVYLVMS